MEPTVTSASAGVLTPSDLVHQATPGQLAVRGERVVYTLRRVVDGMERIELWTVDHAGGAARPLTTGPHDHCPRLSPSGTRLAFLRSDGSVPAQAMLLDLPGGQPRRVTAFPRGVQDLAWSAGEDALIVLAEDAESERVQRAPGLPEDATPTAIRLTTIDWRADGEDGQGLRLYPRHLHRVPLPEGPPQRLTDGQWSARRPRTDDRGRVYFLADTAADADLGPAAQVYRIDPDGAGVRRLTRMPGGVERFHLRAGRLRVLAHRTAERPDDEPARWYDIAAGEPVELGGPAAPSRWHGRLGDETDLHEWQLELDDAFATSTTSRDGATVPVCTETGASLATGAVVCGALAQDGPRRVAVLAVDSGAPDVYALDDAGPRRLTEHGAWLDAYERSRRERIEIDGPAGPITVHLLHPVGAPAAKGTVLALHGGPTGQWAMVPPLEALLLAAAGYRVAMPNIRGSIDRGPSWVAPLRGAWGEVDAADALAVCDGLVAAGLAQPDRLGVMGLSYGGFLTQWLIGVTDRFAAAVSENGVTNQVSAWAACDTGPAFCRSSRLGDPLSPEGVERLWACSPLRNVAAIHTPLLMLQGADDRTCPASDNEQLFVALRALRREVEYVVYPEESHLMQATGRIDRRIDRHQRVLAWFGEHLGHRGTK